MYLMKSHFQNKCIRCGKCCKEEVCKVGFEAFGSIQPPCKGLIQIDGEYACIFVKAEEEFKLDPYITRALGIGKGCDSDIDGKSYAELEKEKNNGLCTTK